MSQIVRFPASLKDFKQLNAQYFNQTIDFIDKWWNDHDSGIRAWTSLLVNGLNMNSNKITNLANGTASTDAAAFGQVPVVTAWAAYTPTIVGVGTATSINFGFQRIADHVWVKGVFTTGTCTATSVSITTPGALTINNTIASTNWLLGWGDRIFTAAGPTTHAVSGMMDAWYDGTNTNLVFLSVQSGSNVFTKNGGTTLFTNGDSCSVFFDYPI